MSPVERALLRDALFLLVARATHGDAAQAVAADLARGAEREVENAAACVGTAVLHGAANLFAVLQIGDDEDGAERFGAMGAGDLVGLEALAARVPLVLPVDGGFLVVRWRPGDPSHPFFLEAVRKSVRRGQRHQCDSAQFGNTANTAGAILCHDANILLLAGSRPPEFRANRYVGLWRWRGGYAASAGLGKEPLGVLRFNNSGSTPIH